jgi:hypothetical protein
LNYGPVRSRRFQDQGLGRGEIGNLGSGEMAPAKHFVDFEIDVGDLGGRSQFPERDIPGF